MGSGLSVDYARTPFGIFGEVQPVLVPVHALMFRDTVPLSMTIDNRTVRMKNPMLRIGVPGLALLSVLMMAGCNEEPPASLVQ